MCGGGWDWMLCDRVYCGSSAAQVAGNHQHSLRQPEVVAAEFEWNVSVCVPKELQSEKLSLNQGLSCTNTQNVCYFHNCSNPPEETVSWGAQHCLSGRNPHIANLPAFIALL